MSWIFINLVPPLSRLFADNNLIIFSQTLVHFQVLIDFPNTFWSLKTANGEFVNFFSLGLVQKESFNWKLFSSAHVNFILISFRASKHGFLPQKCHMWRSVVHLQQSARLQTCSLVSVFKMNSSCSERRHTFERTVVVDFRFGKVKHFLVSWCLLLLPAALLRYQKRNSLHFLIQ